MQLRLCKVLLVASVALFHALIVFNNLTDYGSNFAFVTNVLGMTDTFPGNSLMWRAITSPVLHHVGYASIIAWEAFGGVLLAIGAWHLWQARNASAPVFEAAKKFAILGLTASLLLWFLAFIVVGGEWFAMWQSSKWNGQNAAFRMFACVGIVLLFLNQPEREA